MEKPGNQLLTALAMTALVGLLAYVVQEKGIASQEAAAYVQAILSAGAIVASVLIATRQARFERQRAAGRQINAIRLAVLRNLSLIEVAMEARPRSPAVLQDEARELTGELAGASNLQSDELSNAGYFALHLLKSSLKSAVDACAHADSQGRVNAKHAEQAVEDIQEARRRIKAIAEAAGIDGSRQH